MNPNIARKCNLAFKSTPASLTTDKQLPAYIDNVKDHCIQCPVSSWFLRLPSGGGMWEDDFVNNVKQRLVQDAALSDSGWHEWTKPIDPKMKKKLGITTKEDIRYSAVVRISRAVTAAVVALKPGAQPTTRMDFTPTRSTTGRLQMPIYKPDARNVVIKPLEHFEHARPRPTASRKTSGINSDSDSDSDSDEDEDEDEDGNGNGNGEPKLPNTLGYCAAIAEFKMNSNPVEVAKNIGQMVRGGSMIMHDSPDRCFVLGLSIEDRSTRLWKFDRGMIFVSYAFNCDNDPIPLIRYMIYTLFANIEQLGYDPTVTRITESGSNPPRVAFIYKVPGGHRRTVGSPISEVRASLLISSGVRVWVVVECDENGRVIDGAKEQVLKDFYPWHNARTESDIQAEIVQRLEVVDTELQASDPETYSRADAMRRSFLTIVAEQTLSTGGDRNDPHTTTLKPQDAKRLRWHGMYRAALASTAVSAGLSPLPGSGVSQPPAGVSNPKSPPSAASRNKSKPQDQQSMPHSEPSPPEKNIPLTHARRAHRRLVYEEKCIALYDVDNLKVVFDLASQFVFALDLFRQAGYLHRDISGGNCLAFPDDSTRTGYAAKLADLESCKPYHAAADALHDPVSATLDFIAAEAGLEDFRFLPGASDKPENKPKKFSSMDAWVKKNANKLAGPSRISKPEADKANRPTWHWTPYNDLETMKWLTFWFITSRFPGRLTSSPFSVSQYDNWRSWFHDTFSPSTKGYLARLDILRDGYPTPAHLEVLKKCKWNPELLGVIHGILTYGVRKLVPAYMEAQKQELGEDNRFPIAGFTDEPYLELIGLLDEAIDKMEEKQISGEVTKMSELEPPVESGKRQREDDADPDATLDDSDANRASTSKRNRTNDTNPAISQPRSGAPSSKQRSSANKGKGRM